MWLTMSAVVRIERRCASDTVTFTASCGLRRRAARYICQTWSLSFIRACPCLCEEVYHLGRLTTTGNFAIMWATEEIRCEMTKRAPENEGKRKKAPRRPIQAKERATILRCLSEGWSEVYARKKARVGKNSLTKYKKEHPKFAERMEEAKVEGTTTLEDAAYKRAVIGVKDPVVSNGRIITYKRKFSDGLLQQALQVRNPKYAVAKSTGADFTDAMVGSAERLLYRLDSIIEQAEAIERSILEGAD